MSGIPETRKLWITPLSPVHMGTDEDYTPTGYFYFVTLAVALW